MSDDVKTIVTVASATFSVGTLNSWISLIAGVIAIAVGLTRLWDFYQSHKGKR